MKISALQNILILTLTQLIVCQMSIATENELPSKWLIHGLLEMQLSQTNSLDSWQHNGGTGKFRFDNSDNKQLKVGTNGLQLAYEFAANSKFHGIAVYNHDSDREIAVTELYWHYRPLPNGAWRQDYKVGSFYAPISLENIAPLWTSPYSITPSVINSWIGEELRTLGVQARWSRMGRYFNSPHDFSVIAALYGGNDTTGTLISWRGWAKTDRQTGLGQTVDIASLPAFSSGQVFSKQDPEAAPFREIDNRPGFYVGAEWNFQKKLKLNVLYYDNQANPALVENGQYAWHTHFSHLALRVNLPKNWQVLSQFIDGETRMGKAAMVDTPFRAGYLMLIKRIKQHRLSLQLEEFSVHDNDLTPMDSNNEYGNATTIAWSYRPKRQWQITIQGSYVKSKRKQRIYTDINKNAYESQLLSSVRYYW